MPRIRLFCAWIIELHAIALFSTVAFFIPAFFQDAHGHVTLSDARLFLGSTLGVLSFFWIFGFAEATLIARITLTGRLVKIYPVVASILFLAYVQVVNHMVQGGGFELDFLWEMRIAGTVIVFLTTMGATWLMKRYCRYMGIAVT